MTLPHFLIIGAGRSGTTSLDRYLRQHPRLFLPQGKAPSYFFCHALGRIDDPSLRLVTRNYFVADRDEYEALFAGARQDQVVGEVSPVYLASVHVAPEIARQLPEARLVAILRNPIERVYARFVARYRDGLERRSFAEVVRDDLREPLIRDVAFGTYLPAGFCSHVLRTYLDCFPRDRIRIYLFEDLRRDADALMTDLFSFLDVDPGHPVDTAVRHNASGGVIGSRATRALWTRTALPRAAVRRFVPRPLRDRTFALVSRSVVPLPLEPGLRAELGAVYRDEIDRLGAMLDRDLSHWHA